MADADLKPILHRYLQIARQAVVWKLEGLSPYDARRPLTPTGTNLLGLVKHLASVELEYFGSCFGRPSGIHLPWSEPDAEPNADMWLPAGQTGEEILDLYHRAWEHSDATISELELDSQGLVPWWPEERRHPTLGIILVHMVAETNRHAGHADIVREDIDGNAGWAAGNSNLPEEERSWWESYRQQVEDAARAAS